MTQDDSIEITAKRLQFLKDADPQASQIAVLMNPDLEYNQAQWERLQRAAPALNLILRPVAAREAGDLENAFAALDRNLPDALFVTNSGLNFTYRQLITLD